MKHLAFHIQILNRPFNNLTVVFDRTLGRLVLVKRLVGEILH